MEKYFNTQKEFVEYFNNTEADLTCFFILSSDLTGLPVDLYADDSGSYKMFGHQPWVYFRNSYSKSSRDFLPVNISHSEPLTPIGDYRLNINDIDLYAIKVFVSVHAKLLEQFANSETNCEDVVTVLKYSNQVYSVAAKVMSWINEYDIASISAFRYQFTNATNKTFDDRPQELIDADIEKYIARAKAQAGE